MQYQFISQEKVIKRISLQNKKTFNSFVSYLCENKSFSPSVENINSDNGCVMYATFIMDGEKKSPERFAAMKYSKGKILLILLSEGNPPKKEYEIFTKRYQELLSKKMFKKIQSRIEIWIVKGELIS